MVGLYGFDVVEIWLPVFYNAVLIGRDKPILPMRISRCSYGRVVRLIYNVSMRPTL